MESSIKVAVSGAMGRLGSAIALGISNANDLQLSGVYAPGHVGKVLTS
jgi:dihydrodipicolinate reductase